MVETEIITVETDHADTINYADIDPSGTILATCSSDCCVKLFSISSMPPVFLSNLNGHSAPVTRVCWADSIFGSVLASCSNDQKVIVWKKFDLLWKNVFEYHIVAGPVCQMSFAPKEHGLILACACVAGSVHLLSCNATSIEFWEANVIPFAHNYGCYSIDWSPSCLTDWFPLYGRGDRQGYRTDMKFMVTGGGDRVINIWREVYGGWHKWLSLVGHTDWVLNVAWSPTVGTRTKLASYGKDRKLFIWSSFDCYRWHCCFVRIFDIMLKQVCWPDYTNCLALNDIYNNVTLWDEVEQYQWVCVYNSHFYPNLIENE